MRVCPECFRLFGPDQVVCTKDGAETVDHTEVLIGLNLGPYIVRSQISEGGMGVVYAGEHPTLGRRVALKVLRPELSLRDDIVERFTQEARAVNTIGHRNIVNIYDFGRTPYGSFYIVMEYLDGVTVRQLLDASGPQPIERARFITEQVGKALTAAHDKGFIHRDVKPENIMLCSRGGQEFVKLLDFGIAKLQTATRRTATGSAMGTPQYMPPEQLEDAHLDHRSDIYALGAVTYEVLTGRVPYPGNSHAQVRQLQVTQAPPPPSVCRRDIRLSRSVDATVLTALNLAPDDRYGSASTFVDAFQRAYDDTIAERGLAPRAGTNPGRLRTTLLVVLLAALVAGGGITATLLLTGKSGGGSGTGSGSGSATTRVDAGGARRADAKVAAPASPAAARALVAAAFKSKDPTRRAKVSQLAGLTKRRDLEGALRGALRDPALRVRIAAARALARLAKVSTATRRALAKGLGRQTALSARLAFAEAVARTGSAKIGRASLRATLARSRHPMLERKALEALARAGDRKGLGLAKQLGMASRRGKLKLWGLLARLGRARPARSARRALRRATKRGGWDTRIAAAAALARVDSKRGAAALLSAMQTAPQPDVRAQAAVELARVLRDARATPVLLHSLRSASEARGSEIAVGLGHLLAGGGLEPNVAASVRKALGRAVREAEGEARLAAAVALAN